MAPPLRHGIEAAVVKQNTRKTQKHQARHKKVYFAELLLPFTTVCTVFREISLMMERIVIFHLSYVVDEKLHKVVTRYSTKVLNSPKNVAEDKVTSQ